MDVPELCDFYVPALLNRAPVAVAISSGGTGPVLTQAIRARLESVLSPRLGDLAELAAGMRDKVRAAIDTFVTKLQAAQWA